MAIRVGTIAPTAIYLGTTAVARVYLGSTLIWEMPSGPGAIAGTVTNPPFSMGVSWEWANDMSHCPFIDVLKIGSPWQSYGGSAPDQDWDALVTAGHITANGRVNEMPPNKEQIASSTLNRFPAGSGYSGRYRLFYTGSGQIYMNGVDNVDDGTPGQIDFDFTANGENSVFFSVWGVTTPITFVAMVHHDNLAAYSAGEIFEPKWLDIIRNARVIRFDKWTNAGNYDGPAVQWANRYLPERMTYQGGETSPGLPVEVICDLCTKIGADPWIPLIASASDSYAESYATLMRDRLSSNRRIHFELSTKVWDGANYATAGYFRNLAQVNYGDESIEACMDAYGGRSAEIFAVLRTVFAGQLSRLRTVMQGWTPRPNLTVNAFTAPLWRALPGKTSQPEPWTITTDYAVHADLDGALRDNDPEAGYVMTDIVQGWINTLTTDQVYQKLDECMRGTNSQINGGYNLVGQRAAYQDTKTLLAPYLSNMKTICYESTWHLVVPSGRRGDSTWFDLYLGYIRSTWGRDTAAANMTMFYEEWPDPACLFMRSMDTRPFDMNNFNSLTATLDDTTSSNLQYTHFVAQQSVRQGPTGRGASDFIGTFEVA